MPAQKDDLTPRVDVLERGHRYLADQMADMTLELDALKRANTEAQKQATKEAIREYIAELRDDASKNTGNFFFGILFGLLKKGFLLGLGLIVVAKAFGLPVAFGALESYLRGGGK
jgi:hypothetical protein